MMAQIGINHLQQQHRQLHQILGELQTTEEDQGRLQLTTMEEETITVTHRLLVQLKQEEEGEQRIKQLRPTLLHPLSSPLRFRMGTEETVRITGEETFSQLLIILLLLLKLPLLVDKEEMVKLRLKPLR